MKKEQILFTRYDLRGHFVVWSMGLKVPVIDFAQLILLFEWYMGNSDHSIICHQCDLLLNVRALDRCEQARCPRCRSVVDLGCPSCNRGSFSLLLTALILLVISIFEPFLSFDTGVRGNEISLVGGILNVLEFDEPIFGGLVLVLVVFYPFALLVGLLTLLSRLNHRWRCLDCYNSIVRWMVIGSKFVVVEVFVLGVLVSLTKISELADIGFGIGFYLYCAFVVFFNYGLTKLNLSSLLRQKGAF